MSNQLGSDLLETYVPLVRKALARAAAQRRLVPYMEIANEFGGRGYFGQVLDALNRREHDRGNPLLSAIVVSAETGRPSNGFFLLAEELRLIRARSERRLFWEQQRDLVWKCAW